MYFCLLRKREGKKKRRKFLIKSASESEHLVVIWMPVADGEMKPEVLFCGQKR